MWKESHTSFKASATAMPVRTVCFIDSGPSAEIALSSVRPSTYSLTTALRSGSSKIVYTWAIAGALALDIDLTTENR